MLPVLPTAVAAAETTTTAITTTTEAPDASQEETETPSKAVRMVEFLVIFTASAGITAYLVVRFRRKQLTKNP
jgi:hypothetical protein